MSFLNMDLSRPMASIKSALVPVTYFGISSAISLIALNVSQVHRVYFGPFLLLFAFLSFRHLNDIPSWLGLNSLWGLFVTIYVMHITAVLYIEKWVLEPGDAGDDDESVVGTQDHHRRLASWKFKAAYRVWSNPRWLPPIPTGNNNPPFPSDNIKDPHLRTPAKQPTMTSFALIRTAKLAAYAIIHRLMTTHIFPGHFRPMTITDFGPDRERFISRLLVPPSAATAAAAASGLEGIHLRELLLRAVLATDWAVAAYLLLEGSHHLSALLFVCILRLDAPSDWPPLFGSVRHVTSLRRFWARFWHRLVVGPYASHAALLARCWPLGGLAPGSSAHRLFVPFCVFLFSGLAHSAVGWAGGQRCAVWTDVTWFVANFVAGAVEGVVQRWAAALAERCGFGEGYRAFVSGMGGKAVGVLWVWAFFFWSVPKWLFPKLYCATLVEIYSR